jgi:hypothetical protein
MMSSDKMTVDTRVNDAPQKEQVDASILPSPVPSEDERIAPEAPPAKEKKKRAPKKLKPAKGPAKVKAKAFITEIIPLITGEKTVYYRVTHPDADGNLVQDTMEFEIAGKLISGDEKEILSSFGIVFEKVCHF